mgnify:CR=1 FL=1
MESRIDLLLSSKLNSAFNKADELYVKFVELQRDILNWQEIQLKLCRISDDTSMIIQLKNSLIDISNAIHRIQFKFLLKG